MTKILILGGYGAVGREAATALRRHLPTVSVTVAGRNPRPVPGTTPMRVDVTDPGDVARALDGMDTVLMCVERDNVGLARACLERGVDYLDVSASQQVLAGIEELDELARRNDATAVLSVGLAPGVTNLLARHCLEQSRAEEARIGVLLGSGEQHGPAALAWTLDGLGQLDGSWPMPFPAPHGNRIVHRFPFSDQYTLSGTLGVTDVHTGLCLDSRAITALLAAAGRPAAARLLRRPQVRKVLLALLGRIHLGGEAFAVTAQSGAVTATFSGVRQSRATGTAAALLIRRLSAFPAGVAHIEQLVEPAAFLAELAANGFTVDLGDSTD